MYLVGPMSVFRHRIDRIVALLPCMSALCVFVMEIG